MSRSIIVSFPRSGSNFLQSVLRQTCEVGATSIYTGAARSDDISNVKSHAPSPEYLNDEVLRILNEDLKKTPAKVCWLVRDPRDAMVSFYEFTRNRLGMDIDQKQFCEDFDWFLAAPIDRGCRRKVLQSPISVIEAYKLHISSWLAAYRRNDVYLCRYEDLVLTPQTTFEGIFQYFETEPSGDLVGLDEMVSQSSDDRRKRGAAHGWKNHLDQYGTIIALTEEYLSAELKALDGM